MKLAAKTRSRARLLVIACGCVAVGAIAGPAGVSAANKVVQDVFVTNTAAKPVPVAPQGTTEVTGTVTVANQPEPPPAPPAPQLIQRRLPGDQVVTRQLPIGTGTVYEVPAGKLLTVEYGQVRLFAFGAAELREASFSVGCGSPPDDAPIGRAVMHLPEQENGDSHVVAGGPLKLLVPGGSCLRYQAGLIAESIPEHTTININGYFTGYLTDAPAS